MFIYLFMILLIVVLSGIVWRIRVREMRYSWGRNPFHRICKNCGAHQVVFKSRFGSWWEEVYPIGNDPDCKCHADAEYRSW